MYGRRLDPSAQLDPLFPISAVLMFAWLLSAIGGFTASILTYLLLIVATGAVLAGVFFSRR